MCHQSSVTPTTHILYNGAMGATFINLGWSPSSYEHRLKVCKGVTQGQHMLDKECVQNLHNFASLHANLPAPTLDNAPLVTRESLPGANYALHHLGAYVGLYSKARSFLKRLTLATLATPPCLQSEPAAPYALEGGCQGLV